MSKSNFLAIKPKGEIMKSLKKTVEIKKQKKSISKKGLDDSLIRFMSEIAAENKKETPAPEEKPIKMNASGTRPIKAYTENALKSLDQLICLQNKKQKQKFGQFDGRRLKFKKFNNNKRKHNN